MGLELDSTANEVRAQARRLALALDLIEARLADLDLGAHPELIIEALTEPIRAFDAAVREAV